MWPGRTTIAGRSPQYLVTTITPRAFNFGLRGRRPCALRAVGSTARSRTTLAQPRRREHDQQRLAASQLLIEPLLPVHAGRNRVGRIEVEEEPRALNYIGVCSLVG